MSQKKITLPVLFAPHARSSEDELVDPWELRDRFLSCPVERWTEFRDWLEEAVKYRRRKKVTQRDFEELQELFRQALVLPAKEWETLYGEFDLSDAVVRLFLPIHIELKWDEDVPTGIILRAKGLEAIFLSIKIDKLQGAEFKICARPDCHEPPFRSGRRQKEYCSYDCAHLMAVRRSRSLAAKGTKKKSRKFRILKSRG